MRTAAEVAAELRCSPRYVRTLAKRLGVGINVGGKSGYRFADNDVAAMVEHLRPKPVVQRRRRSA